MKRLAASLAAVTALSIQLDAQERGGSTEQIRLALQSPPPVRNGTDVRMALQVLAREALNMSMVDQPPRAAKLGPFTLEPPQLPGEIIRFSLPVGQYVSRGAHALARANRRRQEAAARRRVEADLRAFKERQPPQK